MLIRNVSITNIQQVRLLRSYIFHISYVTNTIAKTMTTCCRNIAFTSKKMICQANIMKHVYCYLLRLCNALQRRKFQQESITEIQNSVLNLNAE